MTRSNRWLLPDGVDEVLPPKAAQLESLRRSLLDLFASWGYELVIPPMIEYLDSLLTGSGSDLDLQTFKITDQISGRLLGLRADITPQVARIDAHSLNRDDIVRLCYAETVVHARAEMLKSRIPIRIGAELFGHTGLESDLEIVSLMIESLKQLGFESVHLELGDVSIFRQLIEQVDISEEDEEAIFDTIQRKASADLEALVGRLDLPADISTSLLKLPRLVGDESILENCLDLFGPDIKRSIANLMDLCNEVDNRYEDVEIYIDMSELRGYNYHTGIVFAAYLPGHGHWVAKGGRYDRIGDVFGRSRPATGFDLDLKTLADLRQLEITANKVVSARLLEDATRDEKRDQWLEIQALRANGTIVVTSFQHESNLEADFVLTMESGQWILK